MIKEVEYDADKSIGLFDTYITGLMKDKNLKNDDDYNLYKDDNWARELKSAHIDVFKDKDINIIKNMSPNQLYDTLCKS